jgi:hypothetical protein
MKSLLFKSFVSACLVAVLCFAWSGAIGQEAAKKRPDKIALLTLRLKTARLPSDVLEKANKIVAEHAPKIADAEAKRDAALPPEQRQALMQAATDAAKRLKEGGSANDSAADVVAAMKGLKLTPEQAAKYKAGQQTVVAAQDAMNDALRGVLTADQQAKVGIAPKKKN